MADDLACLRPRIGHVDRELRHAELDRAFRQEPPQLVGPCLSGFVQQRGDLDHALGTIRESHSQAIALEGLDLRDSHHGDLLRINPTVVNPT
mgnify:CR=1 FL=1